MDSTHSLIKAAQSAHVQASRVRTTPSRTDFNELIKHQSQIDDNSQTLPNLLFQIQADRIHTNTTRQRPRAKACTLFAPEPLGVLRVKALHRPHCGASIVWHLAGKIASHPNTKRPQHECEAGCIHYLKMKTLTAHIQSRDTHTITASAGTGLVQPHSFSEDSCFGF